MVSGCRSPTQPPTPPEPGPPTVVARWLDGATETEESEISDDLVVRRHRTGDPDLRRAAARRARARLRGRRVPVDATALAHPGAAVLAGGRRARLPRLDRPRRRRDLRHVALRRLGAAKGRRRHRACLRGDGAHRAAAGGGREGLRRATPRGPRRTRLRPPVRAMSPASRTRRSSTSTCSGPCGSSRSPRPRRASPSTSHSTCRCPSTPTT